MYGDNSQMKVILITGLDGSGKSTILERIAEQKKLDNVNTLLLPHIDLTQLVQGSELYQTASFVNNLSHEADVRKVPQLKAVALFASMLLFKELLALSNSELVFCERHPLIDSRIYARFYAQKLKPGSVSKEVSDNVDQLFHNELNYLLDLLPGNFHDKTVSPVKRFMQFIYEWFFIKNKTRLSDLKELFKVDLPDKIFYLDAKPEILFHRIKNRKVHEAHESVEVFELLNQAYHKLFDGLNHEHPGKIEIVDASTHENLNNFFENTIFSVIKA